MCISCLGDEKHCDCYNIYLTINLSSQNTYNALIMNVIHKSLTIIIVLLKATNR